MKNMKTIIIALFMIMLMGTAAVAAERQRVKLPDPARAGGRALLDALSERQTSRKFADVDLTAQQMSNLLWAVAGVNRDNGKTTYPTSQGRKDMTLFAVTREGIYRYLPESHELEQVSAGDHREKAGKGPMYVSHAAVHLAFVQDISLWSRTPEEGAGWGFVHAGAMMQNAYLYAASHSWSAVARGYFDQGATATLLKLPGTQVVRLMFSIGPK